MRKICSDNRDHLYPSPSPLLSPKKKPRRGTGFLNETTAGIEGGSEAAVI
jgi:hypothetical protein